MSSSTPRSARPGRATSRRRSKGRNDGGAGSGLRVGGGRFAGTPRIGEPRLAEEERVLDHPIRDCSEAEDGYERHCHHYDDHPFLRRGDGLLEQRCSPELDGPVQEEDRIREQGTGAETRVFMWKTWRLPYRMGNSEEGDAPLLRDMHLPRTHVQAEGKSIGPNRLIRRGALRNVPSGDARR